jgi:ribosomal protein L11 methylase PrmA
MKKNSSGLSRKLFRRRYSVVVNIGCAEGYYAVGFALRMPDAIVYAFDIDPTAQHYCANLAKLNCVSERVGVNGFCGHRQLQQLCGHRSVILCDCEGFEWELLEPAAVPRLATTDILVELHEFIKSGVTDTIFSRFRDTHSATLTDTRDRDAKSYPMLEAMAHLDRHSVLCEHRPAPMQWAYLDSKG